MNNSSSKFIQIIDDEKLVRDSLSLLLGRNFKVKAEASARNLFKKLKENKDQQPDLLLLDIFLDTEDGMQILKKIKQDYPEIPVIMLSGNNTVRLAVDAMKYGAEDYITKPFDIDEITEVVSKVLDEDSEQKNTQCKQNKVINANKATNNESIQGNDVEEKVKIIGQSERLLEIIHSVERLANHNTTVLITGESGTGKELIARRIHYSGKRAEQPFIALNCSAFPDNLIEAELFGYEKGAFTGANQSKAGLIELADQGTLFLDEIGELSLVLQVKLLRFLQEKEFYRIGGKKKQQVDVRIVTATNQNLEELIKEKLFREDFYYRINVVKFNLPSLKDRGDDLSVLLDYFSSKIAAEYDCPELEFSQDTLDCFEKYSWPGNVRELENTIESLYALCRGEKVVLEDLPSRIKNYQVSSHLKDELEILVDEDIDFREAGEDFEKKLIIHALKRANNIQTKAAKILGITRRMLKYKMDKFGIVVKK